MPFRIRSPHRLPVKKLYANFEMSFPHGAIGQPAGNADELGQGIVDDPNQLLLSRAGGKVEPHSIGVPIRIFVNRWRLVSRQKPNTTRRASMDRRLQIHVLRNIRDNQGWDWGPGWVMTETGEAAIRFQQSGFTDQEYFGCGLALIASGKVVSGTQPGNGLGKQTGSSRFNHRRLRIPPKA